MTSRSTPDLAAAPAMRRSFLQPLADTSLHAVVAGFVAMMTGYTSSLVLVFQAGRAAHLSDAQVSSWIWALSIGMAFSTIVLSLRFRTPVVVAYSTPGAALLIAALPLRVGYTKEFPVVDRWARDEAHRISNVKLSVPGIRTIETRLGRLEALEVELAASDGSSSSRHFVRTEPPRYPFRIEYKRGDLNLVSEVIRMVFAYGP